MSKFTAQERRQGREIALQILFQREFQSPLTSQDVLNLIGEKVDENVLRWIHTLIDGVVSHQSELDKSLQSVSQKWKVERMSLVDRNILRVALFELHYATEKSKPQIAINEAVEIAKKYGSTESSAFVNGVLDQLCREMA